MVVDSIGTEYNTLEEFWVSFRKETSRLPEKARLMKLMHLMRQLGYTDQDITKITEYVYSRCTKSTPYQEFCFAMRGYHYNNPLKSKGDNTRGAIDRVLTKATEYYDDVQAFRSMLGIE